MNANKRQYIQTHTNTYTQRCRDKYVCDCECICKLIIGCVIFIFNLYIYSLIFFNLWYTLNQHGILGQYGYVRPLCDYLTARVCSMSIILSTHSIRAKKKQCHQRETKLREHKSVTLYSPVLDSALF